MIIVTKIAGPIPCPDGRKRWPTCEFCAKAGITPRRGSFAVLEHGTVTYACHHHAGEQHTPKPKVMSMVSQRGTFQSFTGDRN